jgi:hypothetical protein
VISPFPEISSRQEMRYSIQTVLYQNRLAISFLIIIAVWEPGADPAGSLLLVNPELLTVKKIWQVMTLVYRAYASTRSRAVIIPAS